MNASSRPQAARSLAGFASVRSVATWRKGPMRLVCSSGGSERRMASIRRSLASAGVKRTNTALGARVEGRGTLGIDDDGIDEEVCQARVESAPALAAIGALEDPAAPRARVEGGGGLGVDRQGADECVRGGREIGDGAPALPAVG